MAFEFKYEFPKIFSYGYGWRFRLSVFDNDFDDQIYTCYFMAPSMVTARQVAANWRAEFLIQNGINEDLFIYDLYNLSFGDRRLIK